MLTTFIMYLEHLKQNSNYWVSYVSFVAKQMHKRSELSTPSPEKQAKINEYGVL